METHAYDIIDFEMVRLELGDTFPLTTGCLSENNGDPHDILWKSSRESVAFVDNTGIVTAVGLGTAVITADFHGSCESCRIQVIEKQFPFVDVSQEDWNYDAVNYVQEKKLMNGLSKSRFGPDGLVTRAQFVTILYRLDGAPKIGYEEKYADIPPKKWYTDAILWAGESGIAGGYGAGRLFGPDDRINREQMAVMLYRYARFRGYDTGKRADLDSYQDEAQVSEYAREAVQWALGSNIMTEKENQRLIRPGSYATRAECAVIIYRFSLGCA